MTRASEPDASPVTGSRARVRPPLPPGLVLLIAAAAVSWSGPLVRLSEAPALAIAAWRVVFSVLFIALILLARGGGRAVLGLGRGEWALAVTSGVLLAAHFWSWIASVDLTTIASSVVLVSTQPIFVAALSAWLLAEPAGRREWAGILVAVAGATVIGWGGFAAGGAALLGDGLALLGAVFVAGYFIIGRRLRRTMDLWTYTGVVYGVAGCVLLLLCLAAPGVPLIGYPAREWVIFLALAAGPMMLGHTGFNYALRYMRAYAANLVVLAEPIGATALAWALPAIAETPPLRTLLGGALILLGIGLGVRLHRGGAAATSA